MCDKSLVIDILEELLEAIIKVEKRCSNINSSDDFLQTEEKQILLDSICMQLIAIGEGVKNIDKITDKVLLKNYTEIEWSNIAGMRDILSYHYFDINAETIFTVCKEHIKLLKRNVENIKQDLQGA